MKIEEIDRIAGNPEPVIRNLQITQCYYELSQAFRQNFGPAANWCTFAAWASKQAGQSIRREDLVRSFDYYSHRSPEIGLAIKALTKIASGTGLPPDLKRSLEILLREIRPEEIFDRVSDAVARGNKKVFEEIGRIFADFLLKFQADPAFDSKKISDFCSQLSSGDPPQGQGLLCEAFKNYYRASFTKEPKEREELLFFGNLLVGYHEQTRLQPEIAEAQNAPFENRELMKERLLKIVLPGFWHRLRHKAARLLGRELPLDRTIERLMNQIQIITRRVTTEYMMTLHLAEGEVLRLGHDLKGSFPDTLKEIKDSQLTEFLNRVDPTADSLRQSGAQDWSDFDERMHFISDFFRAYHNNLQLFHPPFTDYQVKEIKSGKLPAGRL